jgi:hypothetical protein
MKKTIIIFFTLVSQLVWSGEDKKTLKYLDKAIGDTDKEIGDYLPPGGSQKLLLTNKDLEADIVTFQATNGQYVTAKLINAVAELAEEEGVQVEQILNNLLNEVK